MNIFRATKIEKSFSTRFVLNAHMPGNENKLEAHGHFMHGPDGQIRCLIKALPFPKETSGIDKKQMGIHFLNSSKIKKCLFNTWRTVMPLLLFSACKLILKMLKKRRQMRFLSCLFSIVSCKTDQERF